jgi:hypothetical protein
MNYIICYVCCNPNPVLFSFTIYIQASNKSNTTGDTNGAGNDYISGASVLIPDFFVGLFCTIFSFLCSVL